MKPKNILITIAFLAIAPVLFSQTNSPKGVSIENCRTVREGDRLSVAMNIVLDGMKVSSNDMIVLTPVLTSNSGEAEAQLPPVVVTGKKRFKLLQRATRLNNHTGLDAETTDIVQRKNNTSQQIAYTADLPLTEWLRDASLVLRETATGCANCDKGEELLTLTPRVIPGVYVPSYKLTYIIPEVEVKTRSDRHTAMFNFVVDRYELLRDYKGNAAEFREVDRVISDIQNNPDFEITEFEIHGYASPEASVPHNRMLAHNRANAFADYLVSKFGIERNRFKVTGHGEDWNGLREKIAASTMGDKQDVLKIIDNVSNPDDRDSEIKKLSGGETYRTLLNNFYPPLRRTEYVVAYNVRPFNVEEAREIIKTNPRLLSLNEMYLVAQSYPAGSAEFKEVFNIATRHYPDSDIAIINSTSANIEGGNMDDAIDRMSKISNNPKVWNNLGVAYARKGDLEKAKEYFTKAAGQNNSDSRHNLEELEKVLGNK